MVSDATSRDSARVVFPAPEWPTRTTFRIFAGLSTTGALPGVVALLSAIAASPSRDATLAAGRWGRARLVVRGTSRHGVVRQGSGGPATTMRHATPPPVRTDPPRCSLSTFVR